VVAEFLLIIHILSAAAWLGGSFLIGFAGPRMAKAGGESLVSWLGVLLEAGTKFFLPAGLLTALSGILIVVVEEHHSWSEVFVGIGLVVAVVVLSIGLFVNGPAGQGALAAIKAGDMPTAVANARKAAIGGIAMMLLLVAAEVSMVLRLGA
jgi:hypothetical protein